MVKSFYRAPKIYPPYTSDEKSPFSFQKIFIIFLVLFLSGLIYFLFRSPFFQIKNIIFDGHPSFEIAQATENWYGKNVFLFPVSSLEQKFKDSNPELATFEIYRGLPDTLKIKIQVRKGVLLWQSGNKLYSVDKEGFAFGEKEILPQAGGEVLLSSDSLPLVVDSKALPVTSGKRFLTPQFIEAVEKIAREFPSLTGGIGVKNFQIGETTFQLELVTGEGWKVLFDTTREISDQLSLIPQILSSYRDQIEEYLDLRVEGRVYYK